MVIDLPAFLIGKFLKIKYRGVADLPGEAGIGGKITPFRQTPANIVF